MVVDFIMQHFFLIFIFLFRSDMCDALVASFVGWISQLCLKDFLIGIAFSDKKYSPPGQQPDLTTAWLSECSYYQKSGQRHSLSYCPQVFDFTREFKCVFEMLHSALASQISVYFLALEWPQRNTRSQNFPARIKALFRSVTYTYSICSLQYWWQAAET